MVDLEFEINWKKLIYNIVNGNTAECYNMLVDPTIMASYEKYLPDFVTFLLLENFKLDNNMELDLNNIQLVINNYKTYTDNVEPYKHLVNIILLKFLYTNLMTEEINNSIIEILKDENKGVTFIKNSLEYKETTNFDIDFTPVINKYFDNKFSDDLKSIFDYLNTIF
jgi:hypothetical protein